MHKHNWHIALLQETGVVQDTEVNIEDRLAQRLSNKIYYNSPSAHTL
jgi:hypothetical protein